MWGWPLRKNTRKESDKAPFFSPASGAPKLFLPLASSFFHSILSHPPPSSPNPHHPPHRHLCTATTPFHPPFIHRRLKQRFLQPPSFSAMPQSSKRKSIIIRVPTSPKPQNSRQATEENNDHTMSSPNNNSIVVGGPRRPAARRSNVAHVPDSEESDADMDVGSCHSTIDQPIDTSVMAKNAVAFSAAPASVPVIADAVAAEVNTNNQTNGTDRSLVLIEPRAIPVHPKNAPGNIAKASISQHLSLEEITMRQLQEDIEAYEMDQNFCAALLDEDNLTPQETRTIRIRQFDLMHQLRAARHRTELLTVKTGPVRGRAAKVTAAAASLAASAYRSATNGGQSSAAALNNGHLAATAHDTSTPVPGSPSKPKTAGTKRASLHYVDGDDGDPSDGDNDPLKDEPDDHTVPAHKRPRLATPRLALTASSNPAPSEFKRYEIVTRLGYWMCRLCLSPKYMAAGAGRHPAMPCKWPLRDTSKLVGHHVNMHHEHTRAERCAELAVALDHNRGPLEYWLTTTKTFDIGDGTVINEIIDQLKVAKVHPVLKQLNRAAREMETE